MFVPKPGNLAPVVSGGSRVALAALLAPAPVRKPRATSLTLVRAAKRIEDLVVASVAVLLCSPVMLLVALLIRCTSPGPVLFRQIRIGLHGNHFEILKFLSRDNENSTFSDT